jgi:hypothetical protein
VPTTKFQGAALAHDCSLPCSPSAIVMATVPRSGRCCELHNRRSNKLDAPTVRAMTDPGWTMDMTRNWRLAAERYAAETDLRRRTELAVIIDKNAPTSARLSGHSLHTCSNAARTSRAPLQQLPKPTASGAAIGSPTARRTPASVASLYSRRTSHRTSSPIGSSCNRARSIGRTMLNK